MIRLPDRVRRFLYLVALVVGFGGGLVAQQVAVKTAQVEPEEQAFVTLLNSWRTEHSLKPVLLDPRLMEAAEWKADDLAKTGGALNHTDSHGRDPFAMMCEEASYCYNAWKAENLGAGYVTGAAVFDGWKNSPGHNAAMLGEHYTVTGIARAFSASSGFGYYWASEFGSEASNDTPVPTASPHVTPTAVPVVTSTPLPHYVCPDFDKNGRVDSNDLLAFLTQFTHQSTQNMEDIYLYLASVRANGCMVAQ